MHKNRFFRAFALTALALLATCAIAAPIAASAHQPEQTMKPYIGQTVVIKSTAPHLQSNSSGRHPAIVSASWNTNDLVPGGDKTGMVNVVVLPDAGHHVIPVTSIDLYATERDGDRVTASRTPEGSTPRPHFAYIAGLGNADITDDEYGAMVATSGPLGGA